MTQDNHLEQLFEQAKASEPSFTDHQFTYSVMNQLAEQSQTAATEPLKPQKLLSRHDWLGIGIGSATCFAVIDSAQVSNLINQLIPNQLVISPMTILTTSVVISLLALGAWASVEADL